MKKNTISNIANVFFSFIQSHLTLIIYYSHSFFFFSFYSLHCCFVKLHHIPPFTFITYECATSATIRLLITAQAELYSTTALFLANVKGLILTWTQIGYFWEFFFPDPNSGWRVLFKLSKAGLIHDDVDKQQHRRLTRQHSRNMKQWFYIYICSTRTI